MPDIEPTYYNVEYVDQMGATQADMVKAIYDLWKAVAAICNNLDVDAGTLGTDYMSEIGTDLNTAMAKLKTPSGSYT